MLKIYEKYVKINCCKTNKANKKRGSYCQLLKVNMKNSGLWGYLTASSIKFKSCFRKNLFLHKAFLYYFQLPKKAETISLKIFKKINFKNLQLENTNLKFSEYFLQYLTVIVLKTANLIFPRKLV